MILTITLNPSVDISYRLPNFAVDKVYRCENVIKTAGGKGLNVARVLKQLDASLTTTGFLGGSLGIFIEDSLKKNNISNDFIRIDGETRNCIAIIDDDNNQTEILEKGPIITERDRSNFLEKYKILLEKTKVITISGSNPKGVDNRFIEKLIEMARENGKITILDVSGKLLEDVVLKFNYKPNVIKPNLDEFASLIGKNKEDINLKKDILEYAKDIDILFLSCGKDGSYIRKDNLIYKAIIPSIKAVNPVGSGDSTVAGIAYSLHQGKDIISLVKLSNALGISNAMCDKTGHINVEDIDNIIKKIKVENI